MSDVVIVEAARTAVGKRRGGLSGMNATDLFSEVLRAVVDRAGIESSMVEQVTAGCVNQVGQQGGNIARNAWLTAGLDQGVGASTIQAQCGSAQQAFTLAYGMIAGGLVQTAVAGGVEVMSQVPMTATVIPEFGPSRTKRYEEHYEIVTQFQAADRIATAWGLTREQLEEFAVLSQSRAAEAIAAGRFASQIVPVQAPAVGEAAPFEATVTIAVDEGPRPTTREGLAGLKLNRAGEADALHTAATSSQISDGASALLLMSEQRSAALDLTPRARVVDSVLVGSDPEMNLTGPMPATQRILERNYMTLDDIDVIEVNEAFAAVVLAWAHDLKSDLSNVNVNGGAVALGHPLGATGGVLITKCLNELERTGGRYGLVTMCVGGGMGTATVIERL